MTHCRYRVACAAWVGGVAHSRSFFHVSEGRQLWFHAVASACPPTLLTNQPCASDKKSGRSVAIIAKRRRGSNPSSIHKPVVIITTTQHMQRVHWHDGTALATHARPKIWCCSSRGRRYRVRTTAAAAVQRHVAAADFMAGGAMSLREI